MQEVCLRVLGDKLLAAQAVEGRFSAEGLQALSSGQNTALILANALAFGLDGRLPEVTDVWRAGDRFAEGDIDAVPSVIDVESEPVTGTLAGEGPEHPVPVGVRGGAAACDAQQSGTSRKEHLFTGVPVAASARRGPDALAAFSRPTGKGRRVPTGQRPLF